MMIKLNSQQERGLCVCTKPKSSMPYLFLIDIIILITIILFIVDSTIIPQQNFM